MLAKVHSGAVYGVDAYPVEIEACPAKLQRSWVNEGRGDVPAPRLWNTGPQTVIVGLPDALRLVRLRSSQVRSGQAAVKESPSTGSTPLLRHGSGQVTTGPLRVNDKDRVHTAVINSGFEMPKGRITINLAPADIKKEGPCFDLPIAIGILATLDIIHRQEQVCFTI